ncbi:hypothetical protein MTZ49_01465 [Entomomonas sp. E2T0]|uniref:hypothetical protein n=1 Tax=Entomomonas sp. E2T0 TaxID=2930213 RepID=UPI0022284644|nr:hypothetical protein [Entomomonas sp. E2T0]UYZ84276.1 hypothetical protein MTZ49_01465 [Entomomonas sp. E2T0]
MIITIQHLRSTSTWTAKSGYCATASRAFFKRHGLDWADFVANGIEEEKLLATNNALAINLVEFARNQAPSQSNQALTEAVAEYK